MNVTNQILSQWSFEKRYYECVDRIAALESDLGAATERAVKAEQEHDALKARVEGAETMEVRSEYVEITGDVTSGTFKLVEWDNAVNYQDEGCKERRVRHSFDDAIAIAKSCLDYGGGYRSDEALLGAFHHGIQTVVNALTAAEKSSETGVNDTQVNALRRMGNSLSNAKISGESAGSDSLAPATAPEGGSDDDENHD